MRGWMCLGGAPGCTTLFSWPDRRPDQIGSSRDRVSICFAAMTASGVAAATDHLAMCGKRRRYCGGHVALQRHRGLERAPPVSNWHTIPSHKIADENGDSGAWGREGPTHELYAPGRT